MNYDVNFKKEQKFKADFSNVTVLGTPPTLFTPSLDINLGSGVLTITDGNGDFATYVIEVKGENSSYSLETKSKSILLENEGITHNEKQTISVIAKGDKFFDSETASVFWDFVDGTQGLAYTLNADGLGYTCSGIGTANLTDGKLVIPNEYMGLPVTEVSGFNGNQTIKELIIKDGVQTLGPYSFYQSNVEKVVLPPSLLTISGQAFMYCNYINEVQFSEGLETILAAAFYDCSIPKVVLPKSVKTVAAVSFGVCKQLTEVIFKGKPTNLINSAFNSCPNLTSVKVPWGEGQVEGAPWGATNATITYNYVYTEGE